MEELKAKVDLLTAQAERIEGAIEDSASRRSTTALAVAIVALFVITCLGLADRAVDAHSNCARGNEMRQAILVGDQVREDAFLDAIRTTFLAVGRPESAARTNQFVDGLQASIASDPDLIRTRNDLRQRGCSYWPF